MDTLTAIAARRSIRRFKDDPIPGEKLEAILRAASRAPSGKNRQPWHFTVVRADKRPEMIRAMREGIEASKARGMDERGAEWTLKIMEGAPVTVFVFNPEGHQPWLHHDIGHMFQDVVDIQSAGAAIQNMLLAAQDLGLGSLWICDVFSAYGELQSWLGEKGEMIAAVSLGYADESPEARPRKDLAEIVRYL
jgi:nitroreductase